MSTIKLAFQSGDDVKELDVDLSAMESAAASEADDELEDYDVTDEVIKKMDAARELMQNYTEYVLTAFRNFSAAEVDELTLKFGINMGGKAGIPYITEGSVGGNVEIEVKCTFPK
ncbi:MAG: hypothetical protein F6K11_24460 [Leptolyngbya sp. SIO3F4]|nr:hypothetical protein [Leptolyngbya sp. SIO3F4]